MRLRKVALTAVVVVLGFFVGSVPSSGDLTNSRPVPFGTSWDSPPPPVTLQEYFKGLIPGTIGYGTDSGVDAYLGQSNMAIFDPGAQLFGTSTIELEIAGYATQNVFGIYEYGNPGNKLTVFLGNYGQGAAVTIDLDPDKNGIVDQVQSYDSSGGIDSEMFSGSEPRFGFWLKTPDQNVFYTEDSLNPSRYAQALVYEGPSEWGLDGSFIIAFEDLCLPEGPGSDADYNDFVAIVDMRPVPEASTLILFGSGLSGLLFIARKKRLIRS